MSVTFASIMPLRSVLRHKSVKGCPDDRLRKYLEYLHRCGSGPGMRARDSERKLDILEGE